MQFIVVVIDCMSKYPEVLLTTNITSPKITQWLADVFARFGNPRELVSDNGPQFVGDVFKTFLRERNIAHRTTAFYNPQQNGLVEVFNRYLKYGVQAFSADNEDWATGVRRLLFNYRATAPSPTKPSPAEALMGLKLRQDFQIPQRMSTPTEPDETAESYNQTPKEESSTNHLKNRGPYRVGDQVLTRRPQVLKGESPWSKPKKVAQVLGHYTYRLTDHSVWNARKLRRWFAPQEQPLVLPLPAAQSTRRSTRTTRGRPPVKFSP